MNGVWASLFWKEWREHRWKLAAVSVVGACVVGWLWRTQRAHELDLMVAMTLYLFVLVPAAALFVASGIATGERANRTDDFARYLPFKDTISAIAKLLVAIVTVAIPASFAGPMALNEASEVLIYGLGIFSFVLWCAVLGMNRSDEIRAGAVAVLGVVALWTLLVVAISWCEPRSQGDNVPYVVAAAVIPGGVVLLLPEGPVGANVTARVSAAPLFVASHGVLLWLWVTRYGQATNRSNVYRKTQPRTAALRPPYSSPIAGILRKQLRDTSPVALAALGLAIAWVTAHVMTTSITRNEDSQAVAEVAVAFRGISGVTAFFAALVAGIGLFLEDLRPGVHTFWRSRPIPPNTWFWCKYGGGLLCLVVIFGVVQLGCFAVWKLSDPTFAMDAMNVGVSSPLALWMTYSAAACACCLIRQPIYSAIFAVGACVAPAGLLWAWLADREMSEVLITVVLSVSYVVVATAATLIAREAVRRDWAILR